jgi:hypothetical protein
LCAEHLGRRPAEVLWSYRAQLPDLFLVRRRRRRFLVMVELTDALCRLAFLVGFLERGLDVLRLGDSRIRLHQLVMRF